METNKLKSIIRKHFSTGTSSTGRDDQYVQGDWFIPHHKDSLADLLDEIALDYEDQLTKLRVEVADLNLKIEDLIEELSGEEE